MRYHTMAGFDYAKVKDPTFFQENVLPPHASGKSYPNREEMLAGESSLALNLDGLWKFSYAKNYASAIPGFEKERALLIGDSLTSDMLGAQNAGIDSMWYCPQALRYYPEWEEEAKKLSITYQVGSFEEMRRVLL